MPADEARPPGGVLDLQTPRRIHIVGIGGAGMSAIAIVLRAMGHTVSGSDLKDSAVAARLRSLGIAVAVGHAAENVGQIDALTYSPAVALTNPEIVRATELGALVIPRSATLAAICSTRRCLAVAGTHGKTTTASMLSLILIEAGMRPSFVIGADVNEIGTNAVWDTGALLVVEADESYGTFQAIRPDVAVLTSVEADHLDYYGTFEELRRGFWRLRRGGRGWRGGVGRRCRSRQHRPGPRSAKRRDHCWRHLHHDRRGRAPELGGLHVARTRRCARPPDHRCTRSAQRPQCGVGGGGRPDGGGSLRGGGDRAARFAGVTRRFEFRGDANGVTFVDDYAHLPTEVRAALATARAGAWSRVVAVFQPHRYSWTAALAEQFGSAFLEADTLVVTDVYSAGEPAVPGVSGRSIVDAVRAQDERLPVVYAPGWEELRRTVASLLRPGDLCLTLGAGDLTRLPDELLESPTW